MEEREKVKGSSLAASYQVLERAADTWLRKATEDLEPDLPGSALDPGPHCVTPDKGPISSVLGVPNL